MANAPATCGVAIDVPFHVAYVLVGMDDVMDTPGASRSSCGPLLEKLATASASVVAPTVTPVDTQAGNDTAFVVNSLPEAITVAMPDERSWSIVVLIGWVSQKPV